MRLIDLDSIKPMNFPSTEMDGLDAVRYLNTLPTIDAVPVVRCRECDHKTHDGNGRPYCLQLEMYLNKELDFFCKYGERKEGAD